MQQRRIGTVDVGAIGLGTDFDPDRFLRDNAGYGGMAAGCEYAVLLHRYGV